MGSRLTSFIGRFLIIPIAFSGVCLSMLFGIPMAGAMKMDQLSINTAIPYDHEMVVMESQDHGTQAGCCTGVRMEHDTEATTPDHPNTFVGFFVADLPHVTFPLREKIFPSANISPAPPPFRPQSFLTGTTIKRE